MHRNLTPRSTLENLKREAKRWLKALRAKDTEARARLEHAWPQAPASPGLRDVQHALALEHGVAGWTTLKTQLDTELSESDNGQIIRRFLQYACPDHHVRGGPAHVMALHTADRLLSRHPEIARNSIYTAVVCGDIDEVRRILAERPSAASEKSTGDDTNGPGEFEDLFRDVAPKHWEPLLYLCFTRLSNPVAARNSVEIAGLLLDNGANPNAFFMAGDSHYTPLVGVIGEGEENRPPHPRRNELVELLLERGADAFDPQVTYNTHFEGDIMWLLEMIYAQSVKSGHQAAWADRSWPMFDMGGYGNGARFLLGGAVDRNRPALAKWMLEHGADPNAAPATRRNSFTETSSARLSDRSLYEEAVRKGATEMAELLKRYGAIVTDAPREGPDAFSAACMRLDRNEAEHLLSAHPEYLLIAAPIVMAAARDAADVVTLLLDLGTSPNIKNTEEADARPLHAAASNDSLQAAAVLIERGAEIDPREKTYGATPLWFATWGRKQRMIDFLSPLSRDVWALTFNGNVGRLRVVLAESPKLATSSGEHETPLMWLPADESRALEIVRLFIDNGADVTIRNPAGLTAADLASRRGLEEAAALLRAAGS